MPAKYGGQERIRTSEAHVQQIYSLPPLATWVPARLINILFRDSLPLPDLKYISLFLASVYEWKSSLYKRTKGFLLDVDLIEPQLCLSSLAANVDRVEPTYSLPSLQLFRTYT